jgi:uncharacterized protein DUF992
MSSQRVAWIAAIWWVCSPAIAQKADVEIGVLTCALEEPSKVPSTAAPSVENQVRDAICTFKPKSGAEETYAGIVQGVSLSPDKTTAVLWVVKADTVMPSAPGLLQQNYAPDSSTPADQLPPLVGETNSRIILQTMADKSEGSASATQKSPPTGYVIVGLQLKLKSTSG